MERRSIHAIEPGDRVVVVNRGESYAGITPVTVDHFTGSDIITPEGRVIRTEGRWIYREDS